MIPLMTQNAVSANFCRFAWEDVPMISEVEKRIGVFGINIYTSYTWKISQELWMIEITWQLTKNEWKRG